MDWFNAVLGALALGVSVMAFWRTLYLDQVVADLVFEWDKTLDRVVGKLVVENPLRHSVFLSGIRFRKPERRKIRVSLEGRSLRDVVADTYDELVSSDQEVALNNARIPPHGKINLELAINSNDEHDADGGIDLDFTLEWSKSTPFTVKSLLPRRLNYSAKDIKIMKRAAKRGETKA
jgi:hypothetical protein